MNEVAIKLIQDLLHESCKKDFYLRAEIERVTNQGVRYIARDPNGDWFYFVERPKWGGDEWRPLKVSSDSWGEYWGEYALRATYVLEKAKEWTEALGGDNHDLLVDLEQACNKYASVERFDTIRAIEL